MSRESIPVHLPWDGSEVGRVPAATPGDVDDAVRKAKQGAKAMAALTNAERADLLWRIHGLLQRDVAEFGELIACESGKPIREARAEAERTLQTVIASADEARRLQGEVVPMDAAPVGKNRMGMTIRQPLGIIAAITPFNFPLNLTMHKLGPALAGGNAVVHKPATATPLSAVRLAKTVAEAGAPEGAYNVVTGFGSAIGAQLTGHPDIAMITFTGSVPVGSKLRAQAGLKRVTLELGSNSAVMLEADADLDVAIPRCVTGAFAHSGQVCISVQRIYAHESIADEFLQRYADATRKLRIGHPMEQTTDISSLINQGEAERVERWIGEAVDRGARLVTGGKRVKATVEPTILADVDSEADVSCHEVFGPVVVVNRYRTLEEGIEMVNKSEYGLQAGIFTRNLTNAFNAARRIECGGVLINEVPTFRVDHMPYGGMKHSGIGREGPKYAIEEMTELKLISWHLV